MCPGIVSKPSRAWRGSRRLLVRLLLISLFFFPTFLSHTGAVESQYVVYDSDKHPTVSATVTSAQYTPPPAAPVVVAPPKPVYVSPTCVTGVVTGNYYEDYIIAHESGGNTCAVNASSGACNLFQELPCGKSGCSTSNVACELSWGASYAAQRYGGWVGAYNFWLQNHWW